MLSAVKMFVESGTERTGTDLSFAAIRQGTDTCLLHCY